MLVLDEENEQKKEDISKPKKEEVNENINIKVKKYTNNFTVKEDKENKDIKEKENIPKKNADIKEKEDLDKKEIANNVYYRRRFYDRKKNKLKIKI